MLLFFCECTCDFVFWFGFGFRSESMLRCSLSPNPLSSSMHPFPYTLMHLAKRLANLRSTINNACMQNARLLGMGIKGFFSFSFLKINHFWKYNLCRKRFLFHEFPESIFFFVCLVAWLECKLTGTAYRHGKVNSFICVLRSMKMNQQK